jgi:branched-chain amino acid transport system ATP-binding protein
MGAPTSTAGGDRPGTLPAAAPSAALPGEPALVFEEVVAGYGGGDVLKGVSAATPKHRITCIIGPNGAGKSTLLAAIVGLIRPRTGKVLLGGRDITGCSPREALAAGIVIVPQARSLFPDMTVLENVELGGYTLRDKRLLAERIEQIAELFPSVVARAKVKAGKLSGGQQRLVEFARGLVLDPDVVLLDEPSMGLDPASLQAVFDSVLAMRERGKTVLLVEQNAKAALEISDWAVLLEGGRVRLTGSGREVLDHEDIGTVYLGGGRRHQEREESREP